ncbi:hypothetical protein ACLD0U_03895 [Microbacterium sp. 2216-1]|uniref:hypothetical protein n=1 Tax=Microbacterium TaxID=33882 RepID=UPI0015CA6A05|nr:hypothetical protein [Microbacterium esteraromaticum]MBN7792981.1 hypothetical protein [Microbacterium esteraromaticum]MBY6060723.1 hypothetical protein [Microbacterium esteraromaticum]MCA1305904.1 hypothetical protein [Microbacterium esteraromaticum]
MPELSAAPNPSFWSLVPDRDHADEWVLALLGARPQTQQEHLLLAAELSLQAREASDGGLVLLHADPVAELYAALTLVATEAEPIVQAGRALALAAALTPGAWEPSVVEFHLHGAPAWRVSTLVADNGPADDGEVHLLTSVTTAYIMTIAGRLVVAKLSPLSPAGAIIAQARAEQVLCTLELHD